MWIPLVPVGPNQRPKKLRERMLQARREREAAAAESFVVRNRTGAQPFYTGTVRFQVYRHRLLDLDNLTASLKHIQDGVVRVFLPEGDGPTAPYLWCYGQVKVNKTHPVGVKVTITEP